MVRTYVTFGQDHTHEVNGVIYDRDCVAEITGPDAETNRETAFAIFGSKFCFEYPEQYFDFDSMRYFPRGIIPVALGD